MLQVNNLYVGYHDDDHVIEGLSLRLPKGQIHGLIGANGSGKTTFLNGIYGIVKRQNGDITFEGKPLAKDRVSFLETHNFFFKRITGKEYLELFSAFNGSYDFNAWNELFGLPLDELVDNYSTGMKKKLAFMSLLSFDAPVIILDEPFNGIDMESVQLIKIIIRKLRETGHTIIITSHILESLLNLCDTISYLKGKKIEATFLPPDFPSIESRLFDMADVRAQDHVNNLIN